VDTHRPANGTGQELAVVEHAPVTLFRTDEPGEIVARATETANALAGVVKQKKLTTSISGKEHVRVEGWTLLGTMLGVFPVCVWTRKLEDGWEARVEARTLNGQVVGAAEAECLRSESLWRSRDDYALRSMAQTRATSKALRQPLGFVMSLAGFEATPAEEMPTDEPTRSPASLPSDGALATDPQVKNINRLITKIGKQDDGPGRDEIKKGMGSAYGTETIAELTKAQASDLIERLKAKAGEEA
jgi:hypothetical protein